MRDAAALRAMALAAFSCMFFPGTHFAHAQYPVRPLRIVTGGTGSNSDFVTRIVAQALTGALNQQVIVDNRPSGAVLGEIVARASPDGYTLLVSGSSFWLAPFLTPKLSWHPLKDFTPVILLTSSPNLIVVHPGSSIQSVPDLIAQAKARPGQIDYASGATGSTPHLAAELFKVMTGVNITRINYKGSGSAINDVMGGRVPLMFPSASSVIVHVKAGRMRALAVTSAQPSALAPGLPTVAASGVPGYEFVSLTGMFAPAGTPKPVVQRLNTEALALLKRARGGGAAAEFGGRSRGNHARRIRHGGAGRDEAAGRHHQGCGHSERMTR